MIVKNTPGVFLPVSLNSQIYTWCVSAGFPYLATAFPNFIVKFSCILFLIFCWLIELSISISLFQHTPDLKQYYINYKVSSNVWQCYCIFSFFWLQKEGEKRGSKIRKFTLWSIIFKNFFCREKKKRSYH